jgi:UDP-glucuronate 4-epimerase
MSILVTGAAGFIGSNVCKLLLKTHTVIGIDNLNSYYSPTIKKYRIAELQKHRRFVFIRSSFWSSATLREIHKKYTPEILIHAAAEVGVRNGEAHPLSYIKTNVLGTATLLETTKEHMKHIVLLSSSSVYGNARLPFKESTRLRPLSIYGVSKKNMEDYAGQFFTKNRVPLTIVRPFSVYGPNGRPDMLPMKILRASAQNAPIIITGRTTRRDWTYIDDVAQSIITIAMKPTTFDIVNLGFGKPLTNEAMLRMAQVILLRHGQSLHYSFLPLGKTESEATHADTIKLGRVYGIRPRVPFEVGFQRTAKFFFSHQSLYEKSS